MRFQDEDNATIVTEVQFKDGKSNRIKVVFYR